MPHWWNQTLTLYRGRIVADESGIKRQSWSRKTLHGCFVKRTVAQTVEGQVIHANQLIFRIPYEQCSGLSEGDIVMIGDIDSTEPTMNEDATFVLEEVRNNGNLANAHWYGRSGSE